MFSLSLRSTRAFPARRPPLVEASWFQGLLGRHTGRLTQRPGRLHFGDPPLVKSEYVTKNFLGLLAKQWGACDLGDVVRQLDRISDRQIFAASRMIDFDDRTCLAQRLLLGQFLH